MDPIINPPSLDGFILWARAVMGIPTAAMSNDDIGWAFAYQIAKDLIPPDLCLMSADIYTQTVYLWGGSQLIQYQQDYPGQVFFTNARIAYGINTFVAGVISSAADATTSESLTVGTGLSNLDLLSLQRVKDPYGRAAVSYLQTIGTLWGIT